MPSVGEQLRAAREARKLPVQEVATATNMRTDHIVALEEGNYAPFPAPVYIRGSVRTYAKLLQLDVIKIMDDLALELDDNSGGGALAGGPTRRRGVLDFLALQLANFGWKRTLIVLACVVILLAIYLLRVNRSDAGATDPLLDLPPPTYQPQRGSDSGYLPLPSTNQNR